MIPERYTIPVLLLMFCWTLVQAQDNPIRLDPFQYEQLDRLRVKYPSDQSFFPGDRNMSRKRIARFIIDLPVAFFSDQDLNTVQYFVDHLPEWFTDTAFINQYGPKIPGRSEIFTPQKGKPILRHFYDYPGEMFFFRKKDFFLSLNPLLQWKFGQQIDGRKHIFENKKGVMLRAGIENKIFLYTKIEELQFSRPDYMERYIAHYHSAPGLTYFTDYKTDIIPGLRGHDAFDAEAYLTAPIGSYAYAQFGYGRHFIGQGIQSLLLSDFGGNYLHLKLELEIWKMKYLYMISELTAITRHQVSGDQLLPKKYMALHMLQFRLWKNAHIGLFESVVFNREHQLEWHYLLPIIFFRSVERAVGSPDNILIGADFGWDLWESYKLYSQFVLDEFKASELFGGNQWWANKWGFQVGLQAFDVMRIQNLNATVEYNTVRPYTYGHLDSLATYVHYNSPLAHPLGANFREYILRLDYQPARKLSMFGLVYHHKQGLNKNGIDYGADIRPPNLPGTRPGTHGIYTLQGDVRSVTGFQGGISYMLWQNAYLDLNAGFRQENKDNNVWGSLAFRLNTGRTGLDIF